MRTSAARKQIETRLAEIGGTRAGVDPADIVEVVESVLASLTGDPSGVNARLHADIQALAEYIRTAKAEITAIRADEIQTKFIPSASDELNAIVGATEQATNEIFEAVESIEGACDTMMQETAEVVSGAVTRVYEACSFQDITGQRIGKIVKVLQEVEGKVHALLTVLGEQEAAAAREEAPKSSETPKSGTEEDLMNGPQLPDNAISQDDVDALLASFD